MVGFVTPVQGDEVLGQFFDKFRVVQDNVAPEHHLPVARGNLAIDLFQKIEIDAAFAFLSAQPFALAAAQVPGFVATDVEIAARKIRQQFSIKLAQEGQGARMIGSERGGIAQEGAAGPFVRLADFSQLF